MRGFLFMKNKYLIAKFGGTSVSSSANIETISRIVKKEKKSGIILVVSALSGVTNLLLSLKNKQNYNPTIKKIRNTHANLIKSVWRDKEIQNKHLKYVDEQLLKISKVAATAKTREEMDRLAAFGEIISSYIISEALRKNRIDTVQVIATELIVTDSNFGEAEFIPDETRVRVKKVLLPLLKKGTVPVVTGFIGATKTGKITTLGRGGSDYSASIIGHCLDASEIQIWTDVDGIFTSDPRFVKNARVLKELSYKEASEIAFFGAKVLHPRTTRPAIRAKIPIRVLNTFHPARQGTLLTLTPRLKHPVSVIAFKKGVTIINMYSTSMLLSKGFLAKIFNVFASHNIGIDLVTTSEVSVSVSLDNDEDLKSAIAELKKFTSVTISKNVAIISVVGEDITKSPETIMNIFDLLNKKKIIVKMISLGATDVNISLVVNPIDLEETVRILHDRLLLKKMI